MNRVDCLHIYPHKTSIKEKKNKFYLKIALTCLNIELVVFVGRMANSESSVLLALTTTVNKMIIKTGTNRRINGEVLVNFFMVVFI